jgi:hypothetical protein
MKNSEGRFNKKRKCDLCNEEYLKKETFNFYPDLNAQTKDLKEKYMNFDGIACVNCYVKEMITKDFMEEELIKFLKNDPYTD